MRQRARDDTMPMQVRPRPRCAGRTPLSEIMSADVLCIFPDLSAHQLLELMAQSGVGGAVVIDESGRPVGAICQADLAGRCGAGERVHDVMTPIPFTLRETFTLARAAALMVLHGVHWVPVVSSQGRAIGTVSTLDVVRWVARNEPRHRHHVGLVGGERSR